MIASVSGIRGVLNSDVTLTDFARISSNFVTFTEAEEVLLASDTRTTGPAIRRAVVAAVLSLGADILDYGTISTPALFRESRIRSRPGIMITASHNEPEFNGLKFVVDGLGAGNELMDAVVRKGIAGRSDFGGVVREGKPSYNRDLVQRFGANACAGVRVGLDLGGGVAAFHAVPVLRKLGCEVFPINDSAGIFNRRVDPMADDLATLSSLVKGKNCDIGLAFDCDGDRLCVVDGEGAKRSGDFMLALAVSRLLADSGEKDLVVSQDTTVAVDEVAAERGGRVFRSKVGEANVVAMMREKGVRLGGEGSSGGLIDGSFNFCRDSMLAAVVIMEALKQGGQRFYQSVRSYHQERGAVRMPRQKGIKAVGALAKTQSGADTMDGVKVWLSSRSWVLVRPSNTEDVVRISAEAESASEATDIVRKYSKRVAELSR